MSQDMEAYPLGDRAGRYRVFYEDSYKHEEPGRQRIEKPWSTELRGKYGMVYPYSTTRLIAYTDSPTQRQKLKRKLKLEVKQWGDYEATFVFDPERLEEVGEVLKLKKKRIIGNEQIERLRAMGAVHGFKSNAVITSQDGPRLAEIREIIQKTGNHP